MVPRVHKELQVRWVHKVSLVFLAAWGLLVRMVLSETRVLLVQLVCVVQREKRVRLDFVVHLVLLGLLVQLGFVDRLVLRDRQENLVQLVSVETTVPKEPRATQVPLDPVVQLVQRESMARMERMDLMAKLEHVVTMACKVSVVLLVPLDPKV